MRKRILLLLVGVLAIGLIAAGCGDDDDSDSDDTTTVETTVEETTEDTDAEDTDADAPDDVDAAVQDAVDSCKQSVQAAPGLEPDTVADLEDLCEEAASGDAEDVQEATEEVCVQIVEDTVPSGSAQETALEACRSATSAP